MPEYKEQTQLFPYEETAQRRLLRSLMNVRPPMPLKPEFVTAQNELLSSEREKKGVVDGDTLPVTAAHTRIAVWQGDITRLKVDAIVDADNSALLGCFCPCHGCIDNAIHSAAGLQLRDECNSIMQAQGYPEPNGKAKIIPAFRAKSACDHLRLPSSVDSKILIIAVFSFTVEYSNYFRIFQMIVKKSTLPRFYNSFRD